MWSLRFRGHVEMRLRLSAFYLIVSSLSVTSAQLCPGYCSCIKSGGGDSSSNSNNGVVVNCTFSDMDQYTNTDLPPDTVDLTMSFTGVVNMTDDRRTSVYYAQLRRMTLEHSSIEILGDNAFTRYRNLITLELRHNDVKTVIKDAFYGLSNRLSNLTLKDNEIGVIHAGVFEGMRLDALELNSNSLTSWPYDMLTGLRVTHLQLKANKLQKLTSAFLQPVTTSVRHVTVSDNGFLLDVEENAFTDMDLELLRLSNQAMTSHSFLQSVHTVSLDLSNTSYLSTESPEFKDYPNLISVQTADLSNLGLEFLSVDTFASFRGVTELNLSHNKIFILDGEAFNAMRDLRVLNLNYNAVIRISRTFGEYLTGLNFLTLKGCKLVELVDPRPFQPMMNLEVLDLSENLIQVVDKRMEVFFQQNEYTDIKLDGNQFYCNCENIWFKQWVTDRGLSGITCTGTEPGAPDIRTVPVESMVCKEPVLTLIKAVTDYGASADISGVILEVPVNISIMFQCTGEGDPAPTLEWYFPPTIPDEVVVEPNINRTDLITTSYYKIKQIRVQQSGKYICSAFNLLNTTEAYIEVIVNESMILPTTVRPSSKPISPETASQSHDHVAMVIIVAIVLLLIVLLILCVLYKQCNKGVDYNVEEAEKLNEQTASTALNETDTQNGRYDVQLLTVNSQTSL